MTVKKIRKIVLRTFQKSKYLNVPGIDPTSESINKSLPSKTRFGGKFESMAEVSGSLAGGNGSFIIFPALKMVTSGNGSTSTAFSFFDLELGSQCWESPFGIGVNSSLE